MKRFWAILPALAVLLAFAACGKGPAGAEETGPETTAQAQTEAFAFPFPEILAPGMESASAQGSAARQASVTAGDATRTTVRAATTTKPATAASTQTSKTSQTTTTAKAGTSLTRATTASTTASTTESTNPPATPPPRPTQRYDISVSVDKAKAAGGPVVIEVTTVNSVGTVDPQPRRFTGVRLKDYLAAQGVDMSALSGSAKLTVTSRDGRTQECSRSVIDSDRTLLAWEEDGKALSPPRLCPGNSSVTGDYLKEVVSIVLYG